MSRSLSSVFPLFLLVAGCVRLEPTPTTASQVARSNNRSVLVAYLRQRDASATVCDLASDAPHISSLDSGVRHVLIDALREERLPPGLWRDCVGRLLNSADVESAQSLFDDVVRAYKQTLAKRRVESDSLAIGRLSAMHTLLMKRQADVAPRPAVMNDLLAWLHEAKAKRRLGPVGLRYASELISDVELERGAHDGRPVDVDTIDDLLRAGDEPTLRQYARRLPDPGLRAEARRRIIRLHVRSSSYREVRENAAAIEETLLRAGVNAVAIRDHPPLRGWIDTTALAARGVLVRQDLHRLTSSLLGIADSGGAFSVLPRVRLRGALQVQLEGIDDPVTLCAAPERLDPSPCIPASEVSVDSRAARLDADGSVRFAEQMTAQEAEALAEDAHRLRVTIAIGGRPVAALDWDLRFETPKDLVFGSTHAGAHGPDLRVHVRWLETGRLVYDVTDRDRRYQAIVEREEAERFHVISRGADGERGSDGSSGRDGLAGLMGVGAVCPSTPGGDGGPGQDGTPGEDGGAGGSGGNGGNITVEIIHGSGARDDLLALVRRAVSSEGGSGGLGGSGGSGGHGGQGGSGGSGTTCFNSDRQVSTLPGGSNGANGLDGRSGFSGSSGSRGAPGRVTIRLVE